MKRPFGLGDPSALKYTIFEISGVNVHGDAQQVVRDSLEWWNMTVKPLWGCWKGKINPSFMTTTNDFNQCFLNICRTQDCVLEVSECNKMYAQLRYPNGMTQSLGCMHEVDPATVQQYDAWTQCAATGKAWVAKEGNPDKIKQSPEAKYQADNRALRKRIEEMTDVIRLLKSDNLEMHNHLEDLTRWWHTR